MFTAALFLLLYYLWPVFMLLVGVMIIWTVWLHLDFKRREANEGDAVYSARWKIFLTVLAIIAFTPPFIQDPIFAAVYGDGTEAEGTAGW